MSAAGRSLLVINSSSRIASGVIRSLAGSGTYSSIVCADPQPSYHAQSRYISLRDSVAPGQTQILSDALIQGKETLATLVDQADEVLYMTHDYYTNTFSKLTMIENVASMVKSRGNKRLVMVTPSEYDHYGEKNPQELAQAVDLKALEVNPDASLLRTDLTYGPDSQLVQASLLRRIANGQSIYLKSESQDQRYPVNVEDITAWVTDALNGQDSTIGQRHFMQGTSGYRLGEIIKILEKATGEKAQINTEAIHNVFAPTSDSIIGDYFTTPCFKNCMRILNTGYTKPQGYIQLTANTGPSLEEYYSESGSFVRPGALATDAVTSFLYK